VSENQAAFPIATMCRLLGVSPSGYYAWTKRQPSRRAQKDDALVAEIRAAHEASRGIFGAPRIHVELAAKGIRVGRNCVARLMLAAGLAGVSRLKFVTTTVKGSGRQAPDLVDRNFTAERPNLLWVADITYIARRDIPVGANAKGHARAIVAAAALPEMSDCRGAVATSTGQPLLLRGTCLTTHGPTTVCAPIPLVLRVRRECAHLSSQGRFLPRVSPAVHTMAPYNCGVKVPDRKKKPRKSGGQGAEDRDNRTALCQIETSRFKQAVSPEAMIPPPISRPITTSL
jgi:hypothetical protein